MPISFRSSTLDNVDQFVCDGSIAFKLKLNIIISIFDFESLKQNYSNIFEKKICKHAIVQSCFLPNLILLQT